MSMFTAAEKEEDIECVLEGPLDKEGLIAKATKPRWFVLTPTLLTYFTDQSRSVQKESMFLTTESVISPIEVQISLSKSVQKYKFTITGVDKNGIPISMNLVSTDEYAVNTWIERLNEVKDLNTPADVVAAKKRADTASGKNGRTLRMQKFVASKMSGSSLGQDMLASVVDDSTRNIISAFILAVNKFAGDEVSLQVRENCFKIVTKLAILYQNKVMQKEDFMIFAQFSDNLIMTLSRILMQIEDAEEPVTEGSPWLEKQIHTLTTQFTHFQSEGLPILQKYMKDSNSSRMSYVTDMFARREFLQCLLLGDEYEDVRGVLKDMLYSSP